MRLVAFFSFFLTVERSPSSTLLFSSSSSPPSSSFENMVSFLPFTSRSKATADGGAAPLGTGGKPASPFSRFKQKAAEITSSSSSQPPHMLVPGAPLPHIVLPVVHVSFLWGPLWNACKGAERDTGGEWWRVSKPSFFALSLSLSLSLSFSSLCSSFVALASATSDAFSLLNLLLFFSSPSLTSSFSCLFHHESNQGGHVEIGAATGEFVLIVVARGRVCPVSRNYVAALAELSPDLEALGVETVVVSGSDSRPAAAAFGDAVRAAASTGASGGGGGGSSVPGSPSSYPLDDLPFKLAYGLTPEMMKGEDLVLSTRKSRGRKEKKSVLQK
jgi:hypothetical protein